MLAAVGEVVAGAGELNASVERVGVRTVGAEGGEGDEARQGGADGEMMVEIGVIGLAPGFGRLAGVTAAMTRQCPKPVPGAVPEGTPQFF